MKDENVYMFSDLRGATMRRPKDQNISIALEISGREVASRIEKIYDGRFYHSGRPCTLCGSENYIKMDKRKRLFCRIIKESGIKEIYIYAKNFRCKSCGHIYTSEIPFYNKAKFGRVIVDLALYFASFQSYNGASGSLQSFGIWVDRDTIRRWAKLFDEQIESYKKSDDMNDPVAVNVFKILFPASNQNQFYNKID